MKTDCFSVTPASELDCQPYNSSVIGMTGLKKVLS
jgi:hypothetical protein